MLNSNLPFGEEFSEEATDGLFIIKIAIMVPLPHLRAHLDEEIESAGAGPVHHLSGGWAVDKKKVIVKLGSETYNFTHQYLN